MSDPPSKPRDEAAIFADLAALCASPGYSEAIATICARDNIVRITDGLTGETLAPMYSHDRLIRTEVSTLIGLLARSPIEETVPAADLVTGYIAQTESLLLELHESLSQVWRDSMKEMLAGREVQDPRGTGEALREPVFYTGESAYSHQYRDFAIHRYGADDPWLRANRGFGISTARDVVEAVGRLQIEKALPVMQARDRGGPAAAPFLPAFTLSAFEVAQFMGVTEDKVRPVLEAFALPADDRNPRFQKLQDFSATNATPLLRLAGDRYLLFHIYSLDEALYESPAFWLAQDRAYAKIADKHRGDFPEQFTRTRLAGVFGKPSVHANVVLPDGKTKQHGEIDVLVVFGDHAIVVQNKSKRLTIESRQGSDSKIRDDFQKAIQDACDQARTCSQILLGPNPQLTDKAGRSIRLPGRIRRVFPVCLVADHYPALAAQVRQFLTWTPVDGVAAPMVTDLFALDTMAEILASPLRLLSYLDLRGRFGEKFIFNHELTLLGYHLKQNLWADGEFDQMLLGDDFSSDLDAAMAVRREGLPGPRTPSGILPTSPDAMAGRLIQQFERNPSAVELGLQLLQLSGRSLEALGDGISRIVAASRADAALHDFGIGFGDTGLTVHANGAAAAVARDRLHKHVTLKKHQQKAETWYGLLIDPKSGDVRDALRLSYPWESHPELDKFAADLRPLNTTRAGLATGAMRKVGRNDPCPCGSGRKWKICCRP
jgi:hypothetical protein